MPLPQRLYLRDGAVMHTPAGDIVVQGRSTTRRFLFQVDDRLYFASHRSDGRGCNTNGRGYVVATDIAGRYRNVVE